MTIFSKSQKTELIDSTEFSDFVRRASSREKKRVYADVLKKATEMQEDILRRAETTSEQ